MYGSFSGGRRTRGETSPSHGYRRNGRSISNRRARLDSRKRLRVYLNGSRNHYSAKAIPIADLVDHYVYSDLSADTGLHSYATRTIYLYFLERWIRPHWGEIALHAVRTLAVEHSLRGLRRADGSPLADATKGKIRNIFSVLFNHAIRCSAGWPTAMSVSSSTPLSCACSRKLTKFCS
jgi:hypothetical protein